MIKNRNLFFAATASLAVMFSIDVAQADGLPAIYTAQQAQAGQVVFSQNCAMCHGDKLQGVSAPALVGQGFANAANKYTVGAIFGEIAQQMPAGQPGTLTHAQYQNVLAYILKQNGYPAGTTPIAYTASLGSAVPLVSQVK